MLYGPNTVVMDFMDCLHQLLPRPERHAQALREVGLCEQHQLGQVYPLPGQLGGPVTEAVRRQQHVEAAAASSSMGR